MIRSSLLLVYKIFFENLFEKKISKGTANESVKKIPFFNR